MHTLTSIFGGTLLVSCTLCYGQQTTSASGSPGAASAASTSGGSGSSTATGLDSEFYTKKIGPLSIAAGPSTQGGFGVSVSGDQGTPLTSLHSNLPTVDTLTPAWYSAYMASLAYKVDGLLTTHSSSPNNASISIDPGLDLGMFHGIVKLPPKDCKPIQNKDGTYTFCPTTLPESEFGFGVKGDVEYRYGTVKEQNSKLDNVNQALVGASLYAVPSVFRSQSWLLVVPQITASYYKPVTTNTSSITLPSDIKANYLQTEFHFEVGWDVFGKLAKVNDQYPLSFDVKYDGSRPFTGTDRAWQSLWKLQLAIALSGSSLKPAVTYQTGSQAGFQYDRTVIFGFVAQLLKPKS